MPPPELGFEVCPNHVERAAIVALDDDDPAWEYLKHALPRVCPSQFRLERVR